MFFGYLRSISSNYAQTETLHYLATAKGKSILLADRILIGVGDDYTLSWELANYLGYRPCFIEAVFLTSVTKHTSLTLNRLTNLCQIVHVYTFNDVSPNDLNNEIVLENIANKTFQTGKFTFKYLCSNGGKNPKANLHLAFDGHQLVFLNSTCFFVPPTGAETINMTD